MANLTITVDDETLKLARLRALQQGTSVNRLLAEYLESYAMSRQTEVVRNILELAGSSQAGGDGPGRTWTRDDLYDRDRGPARSR